MIYHLFWDSSHSGDELYNARLVKFPDFESAVGLMSTRELKLPDTVYFEADFKVLQKTDFPTNDSNWPLMSSRMLKILTAHQSFKYRIIPVVMLNSTISPKERSDDLGQPKKEYADYDFSALYLLEHLDAFDWDKSEYIPHKRLPNKVSSISKLVLKTPEGGFPPIFRLSVKSSYLFVSREIKEELEKNDIKGVQFFELSQIVV